jgi:hypothetical protein
LNTRSKLVKFVALTVVVAMPVLGLAGVASASKNAVGSAKWCKNHPIKAKNVAACNTGTGTGTGTGPGSGGDPSLTIFPNPLNETGQSEVHAVIQVEDASAAEQTVTIESPQLQASCGGTITFSSLQGVTAVGAPSATITPKTYANQIIMTLDDEGNATTVVSGTDCAPGSDTVEASLTSVPYTTIDTPTLVVQPPTTVVTSDTSASVVANPGTEVETGDTPASGDSDVYAVFDVEGSPVWAEQEAEISDIQLESSCLGGWIWEPGNVAFPNKGVSGDPNNGPPAVQTTSGDEPFGTIDDNGNTEFTFMGISCAGVPPGSAGSTAFAEVGFNLVGNHPSGMGSFTVNPPAVT